MVKYYKTLDNNIIEIGEIEQGCWINIINPTEKELNNVVKQTSIEIDFLKAALDDDETSRAELEDNNQTLLVVDIPVVENDDGNKIFTTLPLGFVVAPNYIVTVCLKENTIIKDFTSKIVKNINVKMKTRFVLQIFYKVASRYLQYLHQINKMYSDIETRLHKSMKNKELIQLLDLEKSLVYFSTSLRANELLMRKISRGKILPLYEEDEDLLDDVIIEIQQATEMTNIYSNILSGTMDAFSSIISNNLNMAMKFLASITIILAVPTIIASFYGMNIKGGIPLDTIWWFPVVLSLAACLFVAWIMNRKDMF